MDNINTNMTNLSDDLSDLAEKRVGTRYGEFIAFLDDELGRTDKGLPHNIQVRYQNKYYIDPEDDEMVVKFFDKMAAAAKSTTCLAVQELQFHAKLQNSGIVVDIDWYQMTADRRITRDHYVRFGKMYLETLYKYVNFADKERITAFFIRKPAPASVIGDARGRFKDGFHMLIPEIWVCKGVKREVLRDIKSRNIVNHIFRNIKEDQFLPSSAIDENSSGFPVFLYRSAKPKTVAPYELDYAAVYECYEDGALSIEHLGADSFDGAAAATMPHNWHYEMSLGFALTHFGNTPTYLQKKEYNPRDEFYSLKDTENFIQEDFTPEDSRPICAELAKIESLLALLPPDYADDYYKWFRILCVLHNEGTRAAALDDYKLLAMRFSSKSAKYNEAGFNRAWSSLDASGSNKKVTLRTLLYIVNQIAPERVKAIMSSGYDALALEIMRNGGYVGHSTCAKIILYERGDTLATDIRPDARDDYIWYEFQLDSTGPDKFKWRPERSSDVLSLYISEQLPAVFEKIEQSLDRAFSNMEQRQKKDEDEPKKKKSSSTAALDAYKTAFRRSMKSLTDHNYKMNVIKEAKTYLRRRGFADLLDTDKYLLGVGNGVLHIGAKCELITGFHEHIISKFTPTEYIPYAPSHPKTAELMKIFSDIFTEPDVLDYVLFYMSTWLECATPASIMLFIKGGGSNGKTFAAKMAQEALGEENVRKLDMSILVERAPRAGAPDSALMQLKGIRGGYLDETEPGAKINVKRFKSVVNADKQTSRDLNARQEVFRNTANIIGLSNYDIIFDSKDHGTWRRVRYYNAKTKFCSNPVPGNVFEKRDNNRIIKDFPENPAYQSAMLSILTHYYERLHTEYAGELERVPSHTIDDETEAFRNSQDAINSYLSKFIVYTGSTDVLTLSDITAKYISWFKESIALQTASLWSIIEEFTNSRISSLIRRVSSNEIVSGDNYIVGFRLRGKASEQLAEGEMSLSAYLRSQKK